jgi:hypothetical protein
MKSAAYERKISPGVYPELAEGVEITSIDNPHPMLII